MSDDQSVFIKSDNDIELYIEIDGVAPNFVSDGVTSMVAYVNGQEVLSSTGNLNYYDGGIIRMKLGFVPEIKAGRSYPVSIKVWDSGHPAGQVIVNAGMENSNLTVKAFNSEA